MVWIERMPNLVAINIKWSEGGWHMPNPLVSTNITWGEGNGHLLTFAKFMGHLILICNIHGH